MKIVTVIGARPQFIKAIVDESYKPFGDGHAAAKIVEALEMYKDGEGK